MSNKDQKDVKNRGERQWRLLNRDGTFNVARESAKKIAHRDIYHSLLTLSWKQLLLLLVCSYIVINSIFALFYLACGPGALSGISYNGPSQNYLDAFFFSVQTFSTIGYGKIVPQSISANILVTIEALTGMLSVALAAGLVFTRFSRPTARVIFSEKAIVNIHDNIPSLLFRMANERKNQIVEATVNVTISINEVTKEGERYRNFYDLKLERNRSPIFVFTWTVVHNIDKESPLYGMDHQKLQAAEAELIVNLTGIDETFSQKVYTRFSYTPDEIVWNKRFKDMLSRHEGLLSVDMSSFHNVEDLQKGVTPS